MTLLEAFMDEGDDQDNVIILKGVFGQWKTSHPRDIKIFIEHKGKGVTPAACANWLYLALYESLKYSSLKNHQLIVDNLELFKEARDRNFKSMVTTVSIATELYLSGFGFINEGLDLIIIAGEVADGNHAAAFGALPLVSSGTINAAGKLILRTKSGKVLAELSKEQVGALNRANKKRLFSDRVAIMEQAHVDDNTIRMLVYSEYLKGSKSRKTLRNRMIKKISSHLIIISYMRLIMIYHGNIKIFFLLIN